MRRFGEGYGRDSMFGKALAFYVWLGDRRSPFNRRTLEEELEMHRRTAQRTLEAAEAAGAIERTFDPRPSDEMRWYRSRIRHVRVEGRAA